MSGIDNKINFYNQFSNVNLTSNKEYLLNAYANKPQLAQEEGDSFVSQKPKNSKKKKAIAASFIGASVLTVAALAAKVICNRGNIDFSKIVKNGKAIKELKLGEKFTNVMGNSVNVKDDIWDKFSKKTEHTPLFFIRKIGNGVTNVYNSTLKKALGPKYKKAVQALKDAGWTKEIPDFDTWFEKTNKNMYETLHQKGERVTDNLFNKDVLKTMTGSNIADKKLENLLQEQFLDIPQGASGDLESAIKEFNKVKGTLLPKMRDINCGSAPTDLLTIVLSTLGLGAATLNADTKEEKKSILVNLGIPLTVTLGSTTYGTMKALSGSKSLIFGLVTGQIANIGAKLIDKFVLKKEAEQKA